uniref:PTS system fructose-specific EIIABC component n=1 Tax=Anthurium amnicola TaxID=1678845 RepID=A0A1D1YK98_9ARAE
MKTEINKKTLIRKSKKTTRKEEKTKEDRQHNFVKFYHERTEILNSYMQNIKKLDINELLACKLLLQKVINGHEKILDIYSQQPLLDKPLVASFVEINALTKFSFWLSRAITKRHQKGEIEHVKFDQHYPPIEPIEMHEKFFWEIDTTIPHVIPEMKYPIIVQGKKSKKDRKKFFFNFFWHELFLALEEHKFFYAAFNYRLKNLYFRKLVEFLLRKLFIVFLFNFSPHFFFFYNFLIFSIFSFLTRNVIKFLFHFIFFFKNNEKNFLFFNFNFVLDRKLSHNYG